MSPSIGAVPRPDCLHYSLRHARFREHTRKFCVVLPPFRALARDRSAAEFSFFLRVPGSSVMSPVLSSLWNLKTAFPFAKLADHSTRYLQSQYHNPVTLIESIEQEGIVLSALSVASLLSASREYYSTRSNLKVSPQGFDTLYRPSYTIHKSHHHWVL